MKAILEFNLPEDQFEYLQTTKAPDMAYSLWQITHNLRKECEKIVEERGNQDDIYFGVDIVFDKIANILAENGIDIDKLDNV